MPLSTYAELQTSIGDFLNRDDLTSAIPDFITLAEAEMNGDVRHWEMEKRTTITVDGRYEDLPSDFLQPLRLDVGDDERALDLISYDDMQTRRGKSDNEAGEPCAYAVTAGQFEFWPSPDDTYTANVYYVGKIAALSDANTTNWLLSLAPDVYLYGALKQTAPYLQEDARVQVWAGLYAAAVQRVNALSKRGKFGGTGLRRRIRTA